MKTKEIILSVEFDNKKINFPCKFEDAKDRQIAEVYAKRLLLCVDRFRNERINQVEVYREIENNGKIN